MCATVRVHPPRAGRCGDVTPATPCSLTGRLVARWMVTMSSVSAGTLVISDLTCRRWGHMTAGQHEGQVPTKCGCSERKQLTRMRLHLTQGLPVAVFPQQAAPQHSQSCARA
jgi:hypothetical protein